MKFSALSSLWLSFSLSHYINPSFIVTGKTVARLRISGPGAYLGPSFTHDLSGSFYYILIFLTLEKIALLCIALKHLHTLLLGWSCH
jgi:hypothetical protein